MVRKGQGSDRRQCMQGGNREDKEGKARLGREQTVKREHVGYRVVPIGPVSRAVIQYLAETQKPTRN